MMRTTDKFSEDIILRSEQLKRFVNEDIRLRIQLDGGDIRFVEYDGRQLVVSMEADCSRCPAVGRIKAWLEKEIASSLGLQCTVVQKFKKPYYWA